MKSARSDITIYAQTPEGWDKCKPALEHALGEICSLSCPPGKLEGNPPVGISWKMHNNTIQRMMGMIAVVAFPDKLQIDLCEIPFEEDEEEREILKKLYPAGDTREMDKPCKDRVLPSLDLNNPPVDGTQIQ